MRLRYWFLLILLVVDLILFFISWYGWTVEDYELYYFSLLLGVLVVFILFIAVGVIVQETRPEWTGKCDFCGEDVRLPNRCSFCGKRFCAEHKLPEDHQCSDMPSAREPPVK